MNETLTRNNLTEMSPSALALQLKNYVWGNMAVETVESNIVQEVVNRLEKNASCVTDEDCQENIDWAQRSYREALNNETVHCRGCKEKFSLLRLYRCFHCGSFFCPSCARVHFGDRDGVKSSGLVVCLDMDCESRGDCPHSKPHAENKECLFDCGVDTPCSRCHPVEEVE